MNTVIAYTSVRDGRVLPWPPQAGNVSIEDAAGYGIGGNAILYQGQDTDGVEVVRLVVHSLFWLDGSRWDSQNGFTYLGPDAESRISQAEKHHAVEAVGRP